MDFKDFATLIVALFAVGISMLAFFQQWINGINTWKIADEANKYSREANNTASKALEIANFEHKTKLLPNIIAHCTPWVAIRDEPENDFILLSILNTTSAKQTITSVTMTGFLEIKEFPKNRTLPIELLLNNPLEILLQFRGNQRVWFEENTVTIDEAHHPHDIISFTDLVERNIKDNKIEVGLTNQAGIPYRYELTFDKKQNQFVGLPTELPTPIV